MRPALVLLLVASSSVVLAAEPVNVSGTWSPKYWTLKIALKQDGRRVVGANVAPSGRDHFFRGQWDGGKLVLLGNRIDVKRKRCEPRGLFVVATKGNVQTVESVWLKEDGKEQKGPWTRSTADSGEAFEYPWADELRFCGMLRTYELVFEKGSDALEGTGWPVLEATAKLLQGDPALKIEVVGHTDSQGADDHNLALSGRRAETVKKKLVETYGADGARITAKGAGETQPLRDNATAEGKAVNRRVELVLAR